MKTKSSKHSVFSLGYHIVWCTKYRNEVLDELQSIAVKRSIGETCGAYDWELVSVEVMPEHVHVFVRADPSTSPAEIAKTMKSISAIQVFNDFPDLKRRRFWGSGLWSRGTYYGSVGSVTENAVKKYIEEQKSNG